jgi:hypothetical protein
MGSWELHIQSVGVSGILRALVGEFWWRVDWYFDSFFMLMRMRGNQLKKSAGYSRASSSWQVIKRNTYYTYMTYIYIPMYICRFGSRSEIADLMNTDIYIPVFFGVSRALLGFGQWPCASHVFFFRSTNGGDLLHVFGCSWNDTGHGVAATRGITRNSPRFRRIFVHSTAESSELCGHAKPEPATQSSQS